MNRERGEEVKVKRERRRAKIKDGVGDKKT